MNILVLMGSFKDVFSPIETADIVAKALENHKVSRIPMCDGGEYTYNILQYHKKCMEIYVNNVINPYGKEVSSRYLVIDDVAYVVSSEIIRLTPEEDLYKNPLILTDYGLGQLCLDALNRGYKKINLCLGGTSTVGFGMGFAQAMGAVFIGEDGNAIKKPITPERMREVVRIKGRNSCGFSLTVINDGITSTHDLPAVNPQKIGGVFSAIKTDILKGLNDILKRVCLLTGVSIDTPFAGNAGGVCFGIEMITKASYVKGTDFFMDLFGAKEIMRRSDLVITGEGKLDNPQTEKLPVSVSMAAKSMGKKCLYICGQKDKNTGNEYIAKYGINDIICCSDYYAEFDENYKDNAETYRKLTPLIIRRELGKRYG